MKKRDDKNASSSEAYEIHFEELASTILKDLDMSDYALFHLTEELERSESVDPSE